MNRYLLIYDQEYYDIKVVEYNLDYESISFSNSTPMMPIAIIHLTDEMIEDISNLRGENNDTKN